MNNFYEKRLLFFILANIDLIVSSSYVNIKNKTNYL